MKISVGMHKKLEVHKHFQDPGAVEEILSFISSGLSFA